MSFTKQENIFSKLSRHMNKWKSRNKFRARVPALLLSKDGQEKGDECLLKTLPQPNVLSQTVICIEDKKLMIKAKTVLLGGALLETVT